MPIGASIIARSHKDTDPDSEFMSGSSEMPGGGRGGARNGRWPAIVYCYSKTLQLTEFKLAG